MRLARKLALGICLLGSSAVAQTAPGMIAPILDQPIQSPDVTAYQLRGYIAKRIPLLPPPPTAEEWRAQTKQLRARLLTDVVYHGWPHEWVEAAPKFEDLGIAGSGPGYRIRKLRYEIVPGFQSTAILYEPAVIHGKIPAILNVNGHDPDGKAAEYKQKRCINQARQGILSLNLEWIGFGELSNSENGHWFAAHLDLAGANGVGLFYLAMRRGLDYLYYHPAVDRNRIGMTGLSGGGWQTIVLSALDERVRVAVPVAGYSSFLSRLERLNDVGDIEQNATDMFSFIDYTHLTAMRAPRPTLLVYNAEDSCCFRAALTKPLIFDRILPYFGIFGKVENLSWHENLDPANHNYQLDNRMQSYSFFAKYFGLRGVESESPAGADLKSPDELSVGLPKENLTILQLAKEIARRREPQADVAPADARSALRRLIRYKPVRVAKAWMFTNTKRKGLETISYRFEFENSLSASGVWLKALAAPTKGPATIILNDTGRRAAASEVSSRVNRGEKVLALDLLFTGDMSAPKPPGNSGFTEVLAALGDRSLGVEVAQLIAVAEWMKKSSTEQILRLQSSGMRNEMAALIAVALRPKLFSQLVISDGIPSLQRLFSVPIEYQQAPDLFCLGLLKSFDVPMLESMAAPAKITWSTSSVRKRPKTSLR